MRRVIRRWPAAVAVLVLAFAIPAPATPAVPPPAQFFVRVEALAQFSKAGVYSAAPVPLDHGTGRSYVEAKSGPTVIAGAAPVYVPLYETAAGSPTTLVGPFLGPLGPALQGSQLPSPTYCYAYYPPGPGNPGEAACGGGGPAVVGDVHASSGRSRADGDPEDPARTNGEASVRMAGLSPAAGGSTGLSAGPVASAASARPDRDGRMTAGAAIAIADLSIAGVFNVGTVRSSVTGALGGRAGSAAFDRTFEVIGAQVLGTPVTVRPDGVHALGQDSPLPDVRPDLDRAVNDALRSAGVTVRLEEPPAPVAADDGTDLTVESAALRVSYRDDSIGAQVDTLFGISRLVMTARSDEPLAPAGDLSARAGEPPLGGGGAVVAGTGLAPAPPSPGAGAGEPSRSRQLSFGPVSSGHCASWRCIYPYVALLVLSVPFLVRGTRVRVLRR